MEINGEIIRKNISKNIIKYREKAGLSQKELANRLHVTPSRVSNWEQGANCPTIEILFDVCKVLGASINEIYGVYPNADFSLSFLEIEHIKKYRDLDLHGKDMVDIVLDREYVRSISIKEAPPQEESNLITFPVSPSKASAGSGYFLFDEEPDKIWSVISNSETRKADIGITVSGDSMEPLYYDGDVLLVRKQPDIEIGEIGIFIKDGQGYVKKKGEDRLISLNKLRPDIYPSEFDEIYCFGKVVGKLEPEWIVQK